MKLVQYRFVDLVTAIDGIHDLFGNWEAQAAFCPILNEDALQRMKLAVHEWVANLVQHADFGGRCPDLRLEVIPNGHRLLCAIEDNSNGFNLDQQLLIQQEMNGRAYALERGMGLLILQACAEGLSYQRLPDDRQRLEFYISSIRPPCLNIPF